MFFTVTSAADISEFIPASHVLTLRIVEAIQGRLPRELGVGLKNPVFQRLSVHTTPGGMAVEFISEDKRSLCQLPFLPTVLVIKVF